MALDKAFLQREQETRQEEKQAIALNMLKDNFPLPQIARLTGLTIEQLERLQAENR